MAAPTPGRPPGPVRVADVAVLLGLPPVDEPVTLVGVTLDSRQARSGDLFAALPGDHWHGARFVDEALRGGAVAVLTDPAGRQLLGPVPVPVLEVADPRARLGEVAALVYRHPADDLLLLAVTGTNGKTTTTWLLESGLRAAGHRTGLIGTVETRIGDAVVPSTRTTPEAPELHALLARMRDDGVTAVAMEVSSHALALGRVDGLVVDVAGFTQLGRDHLDLHGDEEAYFSAKAGLFVPQHARTAVVTVDDAAGKRLARTAGVPVLPLTALAPGPDPTDDVAARVTRAERRSDGGYDVDLSIPAGVSQTPAGMNRQRLDLNFRVGLPGRFNVSNAALAATMLVVAGLDPDDVCAGLSAATAVPGRMEPVDLGQPFVVLVDYAHTPEALATVLAAARPQHGRLCVVLGAGGDRDRDKRPAMGAVAARLADVVVVTDDNPRSEVPADIRAAVLSGTASGAAVRPGGSRPTVVEVAGRELAIAQALRQARDGDVVVVAGKGHETGQEVAGVVHPFDDRVAVRQALAAAGYSRQVVESASDTPGGDVRPPGANPEDRAERRRPPAAGR